MIQFDDLKVARTEIFDSFRIEEAKRPVKLDRRVIGYQCNGNWYQFNVHLTYELSNLMRNILPQRTSNEQILVF